MSLSFKKLFLVSCLFAAVIVGNACDVEVVTFREGNTNETTTEPGPKDASAERAVPEPEATPEPEIEPEPTPDLPRLGYRQLHQPCEWWAKAPIEQKCVRGYTCVRLEGIDAVCLQNCSDDASVCASNKDGRTACRQIGWSRTKPRTPVSVCAKEAAPNEDCSLESSTLCKTTETSHGVCKLGKCVEGTLEKSVNKPCGTFLSTPIECDVTQQLTCSASKNNTCQKGVQAHEGADCDKQESLCRPGFLCVSIDSESPTVCQLQCNPQLPASSACPKRPGFQCIGGGGSGICVQMGCSTFRECSYRDPPYKCNEVNGPGGRTTACIPYREGTKKLGEVCDRVKDPCEYPHTCISTNTSLTDFVCYPQCTTTTDCKEFDPKLICTQSKLCAWKCTQASDCPLQGMICSANEVCTNPKP